MSCSQACPPAPPEPQGPYAPTQALEDLPGVQHGIVLFLSSRMRESEEYFSARCPTERLYYAWGNTWIKCFKLLLSWEQKDLLSALEHVRASHNLATTHRKKQPWLVSRLAGSIVGSSSSSSLGLIRSMTMVERHAELIFAELTWQKALLTLCNSKDWLAFVKEALHIRNAINIYQQLDDFLQAVDREAGGHDTSIDAHLRSGVYLGIGGLNLIMSLIPSGLTNVFDLLGYRGDRQKGLAYLQRAGGWLGKSDAPTMNAQEGGIRRTLCDVALLGFHIMLAGSTVEGVDIAMAQTILDWNLKSYPTSVFFLYGAGRLAATRSQPARALAPYKRGLEIQSEYPMLRGLFLSELALAYFTLWDLNATVTHLRKLAVLEPWSTSECAFATAACLLQLGGAAHLLEAAKLMGKVLQLLQRKLPRLDEVQMLILRKVRKFKQQEGRIPLLALEFGYFLCVPKHARHNVLVQAMLPSVEAQLQILAQYESNPATYSGGVDEYWDDLCLARFLQGVCARYIVYPDSLADIGVDGTHEDGSFYRDKAHRAFAAVLTDGQKIVYDRYLVYYTHYELASLMACEGNKDAARYHLDLLLSGEPLDSAKRENLKYIMKTKLHILARAARDQLIK